MVLIGPCGGASSNRKLQAAAVHAFKPTATMDVLLASSAGDLASVLSESGSHTYGKGVHDDYGYVKIVLEATDTGKPALRTVSGR